MNRGCGPRLALTFTWFLTAGPGRSPAGCRAGEGYGTGHHSEPVAGTHSTRPHVTAAVLPPLLVLVGKFILSRTSLAVAASVRGLDSPVSRIIQDNRVIASRT
jgi:hypothetical protein